MEGYRGVQREDVINSIAHAYKMVSRAGIGPATADLFSKWRLPGTANLFHRDPTEDPQVDFAQSMNNSGAKFLFLAQREFFMQAAAESYFSGTDGSDGPGDMTDIECYQTLLRWGAFQRDRGEEDIAQRMTENLGFPVAPGFLKTLEQEASLYVIHENLQNLSPRSCEYSPGQVDFFSMFVERDDAERAAKYLPAYRDLETAHSYEQMDSILTSRPNDRDVLLKVVTNMTDRRRVANTLAVAEPFKRYKIVVKSPARNAEEFSPILKDLTTRLNEGMKPHLTLHEVDYFWNWSVIDNGSKGLWMDVQLTQDALDFLLQSQPDLLIHDEDGNVMLPPSQQRQLPSSPQPPAPF